MFVGWGAGLFLVIVFIYLALEADTGLTNEARPESVGASVGNDMDGIVSSVTDISGGTRGLAVELAAPVEVDSG